MTPDPAILAAAQAMNRPRLMATAAMLNSENSRTAEAMLSLAKTQRVLAGKYRKWAREAEAAGYYDGYVRYSAEARRLFRDARWHLNRIRSGRL